MKPNTVTFESLEARYQDFCLTVKSVKQAVEWHGLMQKGSANEAQ